MLHCTALSVHCGGGRKNLEGGVMEDGRMLTPHTFNVHPGFHSLSTDYSKTTSLPGYYNKPSPQPRKSESTSNLRPSFKVEAAPHHISNDADQRRKPRNASEKKQRRFLGGFFRRKKREADSSSSSSSSNSDSDGFNPQKRLHRNRKKELPQHQHYSSNAPSNKAYPQTRLVGSTFPEQPKSLPYVHPSTHYPSGGQYPGPPHTGSLGREYSNYPHNQYQNLGIPQLPLQHSNLKRLGTSMSHDSLPVSATSWNSESAYGSINSASARSSALGMGPRSSSIDTLTKKEMKEALKSRVERLRNRNRGSSSDEDRCSLSSQYGSESSLSISSHAGKRSRAARTERYLRRKSHELETLRIESEKDRRNKEAVQARILEIQKSQKCKNNEKNKWSARLVYQESNEFDSVVIGTPPASPASAQRFQTRSLVEPIPHNALLYKDISPGLPYVQNSYTTSLNVPGVPPCRRSFQELNSSGYGSIQGSRSISFDSNINKPSFSHAAAESSPSRVVNSSGRIAPDPPPRDMGKIFSPKEPLRPLSYSFESLSSSTTQDNSKGAKFKPGDPQSAHSYRIAKSNSYRSPFSPHSSINRSLSERELYQMLNASGKNPQEKAPARPQLPEVYQGPHKACSPTSPSELPNYNKSESITNENHCPGKMLPISCIPPSPSSDYSSYVSENSPRLQQDITNVQMHEKKTKNSADSSSSNSSKGNGPVHKNIEDGNNGMINTRAVLAAVASTDKNIDSDSSHSSSRSKRDLEKAHPSIKQDQPTPTTKESTPSKGKPEPPKRSSSSLTRGSREYLKKKLKAMEESSKGFKEKQGERQKIFESLYQKEKARLQKNKCANFEEALQELEEIYKSLDLNSEDIMDGAEKRDVPGYHQERWKENSVGRDASGMNSDDTIHARSRSRTPGPRRSNTPDKKMDDLHFRRCRMSNRSTPDTKKTVQNAGSYLLVSPAHVTPQNIDFGLPEAQTQGQGKEPDIIYDDFLYRNIQRANAIKVIDPQPPFGIPLGPVTQGSSSDYLHSNINDRSNRSSSKEPDVVADDLAFRNLRKDNLSQSNKSLNTSQLDEFISESPSSHSRRHARSASADRGSQMSSYQKKYESHTPRKVKHHNKVKKGGKFYESYKEAMTDSEGPTTTSALMKRKPSWIERANLDSRWGSCSTSTETLTELSSVRAVSQPDIRQAIIHESRSPTGGPETSVNPTLGDHPKLVRIQSVPNPSEINKKRPYKPLDAIFNSKPKPFYLSEGKNFNTPKDKPVDAHRSPLDVAKLDDLISTLSKLEDSNNSNSPSNSEEHLLDIVKGDNLPNFDKNPTNKNENTEEKRKLNTPSKSPNKGVSPRTTTTPKSGEKSSRDLDKRTRRIEYEKQRRAQERRPSKDPKEDPAKGRKRSESADKKSVGDGANAEEGSPNKPTSGSSERKAAPLQRRSSGVARKEKRKSPEKNKPPKEQRGGPPVTHVEKSPDATAHLSSANTLDARAASEPLSPPAIARLSPPPPPPSSSATDKMVQEGAARARSSAADPDKMSDKGEAQRRDRIQRYKEERRRQMAARYGTGNVSSSEEEEGLSSSSYRRRRKVRSGADSSSTDVSPGDGKRARENGVPDPFRARKVIGSSEDVRAGAGAFGAKERIAQRRGISSIATSSGSRALQTSASPFPPSSNAFNNNNNNSDLTNTPDENSAVCPPPSGPRDSIEPPHQRQPSQEVRGDSAESTPSGSDGRSRRRRASTEERDKSYKRKSHLNRAPSSEEAVYPLPPISLPSDSNEEIPRRRRRRTPVASDGTFASCLSTVEPMRVPDPLNHVPRLTPPSTPSSPYSSSQHPLQGFAESQSPSESAVQVSVSSRSSSVLPSSPLSSYQRPTSVGTDASSSSLGTRSAPSTLSVRLNTTSSRESKSEAKPLEVSSLARGSDDIPPKKSSLRPTFLKKPDIPEVLRPKDGSHITSPGVVSTPPSSRPSSVILDKPPLAPEGVRPVNLRNSLRKVPDSGTCFLASRREKLDDPILEPFKGAPKSSSVLERNKSGDSFSTMEENTANENDSNTHEVDSLHNFVCSDDKTERNNIPESFDHQIDALTAQARELISRVDMLHSDSQQSSNEVSKRAKNVYEECEEYLVQNKDSSKRRTPPHQGREEFRSTTESLVLGPSLSASKGAVSDTGQKNWPGGPEGNGEKVRRLAFEKEVKRSGEKVTFRNKSPSPTFNNSRPTASSGPPNQNEISGDEISGGALEDSQQGTVRWHGKCEYIGSPRPPSPDHQFVSSPPNSELESASPRAHSPSILKRRTSRDDSLSQKKSSTPEPHGILKRKSSSKASSTDTLDSEPRPILKKKSSTEDLDHFEPKPILKKKSLTDDELETSDRPKSILKGARSREDLDSSEGVVSPTPILKRHSKDSEEGELRPILKRRETIDGVRLCVQLSDAEGEGEAPQGSARVRSDSAPEAGVLMRSHNPPSPSATPSHGILKNKRHSHSPSRLDSAEGELGVVLRTRRGQSQDQEWDPAPKRPVSPSLCLLTSKKEDSSERPLSVAERIAGMEALNVKGAPQPVSSSAGARPKVRASSSERPTSPRLNREPRRSSWVSSTFDSQEVESGPPAEAFNPAFAQSSRVSQKAAFFAMLEQEKILKSPPRPVSTGAPARKERGARFATQPVTEGEVSQAAKLVDSSESSDKEESGTQGLQARSSKNSQGSGDSSERTAEPWHSSSLNRKLSATELDEGYSTYDSRRGILKSEGPRERSRESPRSILKSAETRKSFSESDQPRSILKSESPMSSAIGSPEHEAKPLKSVLKKDSSLEDTKEAREIKSILKPQSDTLEPGHSSDSSSEVNNENFSYDPKDPQATSSSEATLTPKQSRTPPSRQVLEAAVKKALPMKAKDDLAEALRQIEPIMTQKGQGKKIPPTSLLETDKTPETLSQFASQWESHVSISISKEARSSLKDPSECPLDKEPINGELHCKEQQQYFTTHKERMTLTEGPSSPSPLTRHLDEFDIESSSSSSSSSPPDSPRVAFPPSLEPSFPSPLPSGVAVPMFPPRTPPSRIPGQRSSFMGPDAADILSESPLFSSRSSALGGSFGSAGGGGDSHLGIKVSRYADLDETSSPARSCPSSSSRTSHSDRNGEDFLRLRPPKSSRDADMLDTGDRKPRGLRERPTSLMERVNQLESSSQQWKVRVSQSDATKFTVAHRMSSASTSSVPSVVTASSAASELTALSRSPSAERKKKSPQLKVFKSKTGSNIPDLLSRSPATARKDLGKSLTGQADVGYSEGLTVSVPQPDDESFSSFFSKVTSQNHDNSESLEIKTSDLDHISINTSELLVNRRQVRVTRTKQPSKNPLKALAARDDLKAEYTEVKLGVGEKELRRMKVEELSKSSSFAMEALAGLASKENFSAVSLKKVEKNPVVRELAPYSDIMLIQVKGRRHVQVRLVEPVCESINAGDDFLLVTPQEVFHYKGEFSNVIERAVASDMLSFIFQTKDLGVTLEGGKGTEVHEASSRLSRERFWKLLGGDGSSTCQPAGPPEEDECLENALIASNKVYEVKGDTLVPVKESWGESPKYELLSSDKVMVFDFGSEMYVWAGKRANGEERRWGISLLKEIWQENFDYSDCDINPIFPSQVLSQRNLKGSRPKWGICGKLTENVETILFKEKFIDWPDMAQQSKNKEVKKELEQKGEILCELEPCDVAQMLDAKPSEPDLVLEMSHLGRGLQYYDEEERRLRCISTKDSKIWHISENEKAIMGAASFGHLHAGDTYVVRWYYHVTATGRTLQGTPSKHNITGRSRVAYFFWQGKGSSISDKGVSALMTVELDEERGPHIRVIMGSEPPAFLNLFSGGLVFHAGRREEAKRTESWRLFVVRGELENEAHLLEVDLDAAHMRSRGCLVLVNADLGAFHLWFGCKVLKHVRQIAMRAARNLSESRATEVGWRQPPSRLREEYEGAESQSFLKALGCVSPRPFFASLSDDKRPADWTLRVWRLEATHDSFVANEVLSTYRSSAISPFPVWQEELYSSPQPALFIVDGGHKVWVWQGWWPDDLQPEDESSNTTGSAMLRFTFARRAALKTCLNYARCKAQRHKRPTFKDAVHKKEDDACSSSSTPQLVIAGMEPLEFTNLFPVWKSRPKVTALQEKEGRWSYGESYPVSGILEQLSRTRYSLEELRKKPLPDGVDSLRLEKYLSDEDFSDALGIDRSSFYVLQSWKQLELKKKAQLF